MDGKVKFKKNEPQSLSENEFINESIDW